MTSTDIYRKEIDMTKTDFDFETWFEVLQQTVLDRCGVEFGDEDSVRDDYEDGKDVYDVIDSVVAEYGAREWPRC